MSSNSGTDGGVACGPNVSGKFFFEDLFLQVEGTLYKLNRRDFEEGSEVFQGMFQLPSGGKTVEGSSAEQPIVLEGVKAGDMDLFLAVVYPRPFESVEDMPLNEWKAVFKIARQWEFSNVLKRAFRAIKEQLEVEDGIDAILVYCELSLDLDEGFVSAVRGLVTRAEDISEEDARRLDLTTLMRICTLRGWYTRAPCTRSVIDERVRSTWNIAPILSTLSVNPRKRPRINRRFPTSDDELELWHTRAY